MRLVESWGKFDQDTAFREYPQRFISIDQYNLAEKFSMDQNIGREKLAALVRDCLRYKYLLGEGGIDKDSVVGKAMAAALDQREKLFFQKTGMTLESVLKPTK